MNLKILVVYHKQSELIKSNVYEPIHVGDMQNNPSREFLMQNMIGDDTGDNIADKNPVYNELTALYWAWKNYGLLGNPDYIGLCHYRRFFVPVQTGNPYLEVRKTDEKFNKLIGLTDYDWEFVLNQGDFVAPVPSKRSSVRDNYKRAHNLEDLSRAVEILKEKYPDYAEAADSYLDGSKSYFHNMFIFDKATFFRYCEWIFDILQEYESTAKAPLQRLYISERLTGIFFTKLEEEGKKAVLLPTLFVAGKKESLRSAIARTKSNLKEKNSGLLYSFKPIIVYFIPNFILRAKRNCKCK